ncbi:2-amino-4-hydroxy-6-hydroxymethyldihydropteridine diphosphokinase [Umezawaea beigongshangensis]|uniref:2-amino-4-hydroxy-6- hydroxymethyldihydropteridine diphosphokinase n=1 Tax=Umezawaea beigongshangensis TaxID=2780383 RepID=UPI0018F13FCE|nr:2-amino-4-hydroxy-6-hydroxymethyldihydropteridine diphosphokinase [Umezawaea beigongshangensis]
MSRAVLSLGSNLGDRLGFLRLAVEGFADVAVAVSPVYETAPWGVLDQDDFLNAVLVVSSPDVDARGWLRRGQELERRAGRVRERHWGPRTLDVDVVSVDGILSSDPELILPHPGAHDRATVLIPWHDVDPNAAVPGRGSVADLLVGVDTAGVRRRDDLILSIPLIGDR